MATPDMTAGGGPPSGEHEPWSERDFAPIVAFLRNADRHHARTAPHGLTPSAAAVAAASQRILQLHPIQRARAQGRPERARHAAPDRPEHGQPHGILPRARPLHVHGGAGRRVVEGTPGLGCSHLVGGLLDGSRAVQHGDGPRRDDPRDYRVACRDLGQRLIAAKCWKPPRGAIYDTRGVQGVSPARLRRFFLRGSGPRAGSLPGRSRGPGHGEVPPSRLADAVLVAAERLPPNLLPQRLDLFRRGRAEWNCSTGSPSTFGPAAGSRWATARSSPASRFP